MAKLNKTSRQRQKVMTISSNESKLLPKNTMGSSLINIHEDAINEVQTGSNHTNITPKTHK